MMYLSSYSDYIFLINTLLKVFKDFMEKDHAERNLPKEYGKVQFYKGTTSQGKGAIAVLNAAKKLGMPIK